MANNYFENPEFRRVATNATDSSVKLFFKYIGIACKALLDFIGEMFRMVQGK